MKADRKDLVRSFADLKRSKKMLFFTGFLAVVLCCTGLLSAGRRDEALPWDFLRSTVADGPHPVVFIYANSVVFQRGNPNLPPAVELRATIDPNGNESPRVFFLTLRNQATGEVHYISDGGLLEPGEVEAIDGSRPGSFTLFDVTAMEDVVLLGPNGLVGPGISVDRLETGTYQLVLDLREASGQRTVVYSDFLFNVVDSIVPVAPEITTNTTWTSNNAYFINDVAVFVRRPATLTIEPGTVVLGIGQNSSLVIDRGAKIRAMGTKARPVIMTSANPVGERNSGDWGGLIINGYAPINTGEQDGEGGTGLFGGNDPNDSSGELHYVRVEFAGIEFSPDNELNGIAFQGVGAGTVVDHIQVHKNKDDGVEFFGGTVNAKYIVLTGNSDDSLDWVLGWRGKVQFVCVKQDADDADNAIEADNLSTNNTAQPVSQPTLYNVTLLGDPSGDLNESDIGMLLREGTGGHLRNVVVGYFKNSAVDVDHQSTANRAQAGDLTLSHSIFFNNCTAPGQGRPCTGSEGLRQFANDGAAFSGGFSSVGWVTQEATNRIVDPLLRNPSSLLAPDFRPELNSPALNKNFVATPPDDGFFTTDVDFIGCAGPTDEWYRGWTYFGPF
ncbi:MAG TPA: hypothetical protein PLM33_06060 [Acidobacteriota bacterium]|nr:hypothetical protein [Acidobacteriota bacterium]HRR26037.1 hypothetical protein [Acidobacteriota bacterium]HRR55748.1 hypothetical protein [Acidobacteriota bacterium]HRV08295.1 hypothetical protein [Acidobacteriota bacterium]